MNPKYHLLAAVAALSFGACTTDDTYTGPEIGGGYKLSFTVAEGSETRTTLDKDEKDHDILKWVSPGDKVGVYTVGQNANSNIVTEADITKTPVQFSGTLIKPVSSGEKFYAYYPYDEKQSDNPTAVRLSIPAMQKQTEAGVYNGASHPLVTVPMEFAKEWGSDACHISDVRFRQLGAIVELKLFSSDAAYSSEKIQSVTFESDTPLAGDFTFDLTTVTTEKEPKITGYESKEVTTLLDQPAAVPATKDGAALVYLTIAPGQYTGKIVVTTGDMRYTFRLAKAMTFKRAVIKGLPADLAKAKREIYSDAFIPFEDPEVKRICVENWDTNRDGGLSYKEAVAVTSIGSQFQSQSIGSFNELQYFTGLQSIGSFAFYCSNLTSIIIPDGVTEIGQDAFYCCSNLTSINIPRTVSSLGKQSFAGCSSLSAFYGKYASADHRYLIRDATLLAFAPAGLTEYTIPDEVTVIGAYAFERCGSLTSIHIPDGVTEIGQGAFESCFRLTSIHIPDKVTKIGIRTFVGCHGLTSITIPEGVTAIGAYAFNSCRNLTSVYCKPTTPPTIDDGALTYTSSAMKIYVPAASVEAYKTAKGWSEYASKILADNN